MSIRLVDKAALKIARRLSAGRTEAERAKSRKGRQNRFFRPCGTLASWDALLPALKCWAIFTIISRNVVNQSDRHGFFVSVVCGWPNSDRRTSVVLQPFRGNQCDRALKRFTSTAAFYSAHPSQRLPGKCRPLFNPENENGNRGLRGSSSTGSNPRSHRMREPWDNLKNRTSSSIRGQPRNPRFIPSPFPS